VGLDMASAPPACLTCRRLRQAIPGWQPVELQVRGR
jgi:hypothetical protein